MPNDPTEESTEGDAASAVDGTEGADNAGTVEGGAAGAADAGGISDAGDAANSDGAKSEGELSDEAKTEAAKAAEAAKAKDAPQFTEEQLKAAAVKYANGTMAAARRAQRKLEQAARTEATWEAKAKAAEAKAAEAATLRELWQRDPLSAIAKLGDADLKALLNRIATGTPLKAEPKAEDRLEALEKRIRDREERDKKTYDDIAREQAKKNIFDALGKDERFDLAVNTQRGREETFEAVEEYFKAHGDCPNEMVFRIAAAVEAALSADLQASKRYKPVSAAPAAKGASASGTAGPEGASSGKTIAGTNGADITKRKPLPDDDDLARLQVLRELGFA